MASPESPGVLVASWLSLDEAVLAAFCQKWSITELDLFGSVLREDFRPDSDVDVLVTFAPEVDLTMEKLLAMEEELAGLFGRRVDLVLRRAVEKSPNYIRREQILQQRQHLYVAG